MSKEHVTLRMSESVRERIEQIREREGFDTRSDATREVLRRGIESSHEPPGEQLARIMTGIAGVGTVVGAIGVAVTSLWPMALVLSFGGATFVCAVLWASVRALAGGEFV